MASQHVNADFFPALDSQMSNVQTSQVICVILMHLKLNICAYLCKYLTIWVIFSFL